MLVYQLESPLVDVGVSVGVSVCCNVYISVSLLIILKFCTDD